MHIDKSKSLSGDIDLKFTYSPAECQSTDQTKNSKKAGEPTQGHIIYINLNNDLSMVKENPVKSSAQPAEANA